MKTITYSQYQTLINCKKEAKALFKKLDKLVASAEKIVGEKPNNGDWMFDYLWNGGDLKYCLKMLNVSVTKNDEKNN